MSGWIDDIVALMHQVTSEQVGDIEPHLVGHLIEYDVKTHMGRVLFPTRRAVDDSGDEQPMESGWIQIGASGAVGDQFGDQYCFKGGATADNPEQGEQVQVSIQHRASGLCAVGNVTYNDSMTPPGAGGGNTDNNDTALEDTDGTAQLKPGEYIYKHESGSFLKFYENGDIGIFAAQNVVVRAQEDCDVTVVEGDLNVIVEKGDANITVTAGDLNATVAIGDANITATAGSVVVTAGLDISLTAPTVTVTGTTVVNVAAPAIAVTGATTVTVTAPTVNITAAAEANVTAPEVNIASPLIYAGAGTMQNLANLYHVMNTFNVHHHPVANGPPVPLGVYGIDTTVNLEGS